MADHRTGAAPPAASEDGYETTTSTLAPQTEAINGEHNLGTASDKNSLAAEKEQAREVDDDGALKDIEKEAPPAEEPMQRPLKGVKFALVMGAILSSTFLFALGT
jgi:hypothetical protein